MKKLIVVFFSLLMALQCVVISGAVIYDGDSRYTIDLPEGFSRTDDNKFTADDNSTLAVTFEDNTDEQFSVADMSRKDVEEYVKTMEEKANSVLKEYGVDGSVRILSSEKMKHPNGQYALVLTIESTYTVDGKENVNYQKLYSFSCVDNKITFTYAVDSKDALNGFDDAFNSIVLNEKEVESNTNKIKTAVFYAGVIIATAAVVFVFVKRRSK